MQMRPAKTITLLLILLLLMDGFMIDSFSSVTEVRQWLVEKLNSKNAFVMIIFIISFLSVENMSLFTRMPFS